MTKITAKAHTNIALIKYWGKANVALNIPTTSSLSMTLDKFYTTTSVKFDENLSSDQLNLNGQDVNSERVSKYLDIFRHEFVNFPAVQITSENHVPTAAGLASSASSFAALSAAMFRLLELPEDLTMMSRMARRGSGSASRSLFGNFALWNKVNSDENSFAESFYNKDIGLSMIVAEISSAEKKMSSTKGMQLAQTAPTYADWVKKSALQLDDMKVAILQEDIEKVGLIAENNALEMHQQNRNCREPFDYFTSETLGIIDFVQAAYRSGMLAFVTLDAGPNVKIITDRATEGKLLQKLQENFPTISFDVAHAGGDFEYV